VLTMIHKWEELEKKRWFDFFFQQNNNLSYIKIQIHIHRNPYLLFLKNVNFDVFKHIVLKVKICMHKKSYLLLCYISQKC